MMEKGDVQIPEFQRRYVWSERQASRLIESLIIQCPIPVIYLNQDKDEKFSVIDGNQRLNSIKLFLEDKLPLSGLTSYPELTGYRFSDLDKRFQRHISNRVLRCTVILKETHPQVKFDVFERLNSGAVALTRQELRHGLYFGSLLKRASLVAASLQIENHLGSRTDKRMKAEELVIRYWALAEGLEDYEKPLSTFISNFADLNRNLSKAKLDELEEDIRAVHGNVIDLFGSYAFVFSKGGGSEGRFNAAVYDAQMLAVKKLSLKRLGELGKKKITLRGQYKNLLLNEDFSKHVTLATSDKASLLGRVAAIAKLLKSVA
jgi:hypothetical protein